MDKNFIPYIAHEATIATFERQIKRQWIALIVAIIALITSNVTWLIYTVDKSNNICQTHALGYDTPLPQSIATEVSYGINKKTNGKKNRNDV